MTIHAKPVADPHARLEPNSMLLEALLGEARATATKDQERGFLLATGQRIADSFPLTGLSELGALESAMNEVWQMLDLGNVYLSVGKDGIGIEHRRSAHRSALAQPQWDNAEPAILEGVYAQWFGALGNDKLSLQLVSRSYEKTSFHYGR